jgi:hypothetical protein
MKTLVLVFLLFATALAPEAAAQLDAARQEQWEGQWLELYDQYQAAGGNEYRRHLREQELRAFGENTVPAGTFLQRWTGTLTTLKVVNLTGVGETVVGQVSLADAVRQTPHVIRFAQAISDLDPARGRSLESLELGALVLVSGEVLPSKPPAAEAAPSNRKSLTALFARALEVQFGDGEAPSDPAAPPSPVDIDKVFPKPRPFGLVLPLLLSDIQPAALASDRSQDEAAVESMKRELIELDQLAYEVRQALSALSERNCEDVIARVSRACPDFLPRTAALGLDCASPQLWRPEEYDAGRGPFALHLDDIARTIAASRSRSSYAVALAEAQAELRPIASELRAKHADYRQLLDCIRRPEAAPPPPPAPEPVAITLPRNLAWGMTYDQTRAVLKGQDFKVGDLKDRKKAIGDDAGPFFPRNWQYSSCDPPKSASAASPSYMTLGFDSSGKLGIVVSYKWYSIHKERSDDGWTTLQSFWTETESLFSSKYGEPTTSAGGPSRLPYGEARETVWTGERGDVAVLRLACESEKDRDPRSDYIHYTVFVYYASTECLRAVQAQGSEY